MKKIIFYLFLFCNFYSFSQEKLVCVILQTSVSVYGGYNMIPVTTNDATLNQIITQNHCGINNEVGASGCFSNSGIGVYYNNDTDMKQLILDLNNYPTAVVKAFKVGSTKYDLVTTNVGTYVATVNDIVQTNNNDLNTVFQNFSVNTFVDGNLIDCNCNKNDLYNALRNLTAVVKNVSQCNMAFLKTDEFEKNAAKIYPNPFVNNINIETNENIIKYVVIDVSGKQIIATNSKSNLDTNTQLLVSGFYILNLEFDNGRTGSYKIFKN